MPHVAVVGAGVGGLLAALRLRQLGMQVTVYESGDQAGGVVRTVRQDGWLVEQGPNTLTEPEAEVRALLDQAGLPEIMIRPDADAKRRRYLLHRGVPVPLPSRVSDLVASPLLSLTGRLRLLKEPFIERGPADNQETVDAFVRRRLGAEVADHIIDPFLAGTSGGDPRQLLARHVLPRLVEYEREGGSILKGALRARRNARRRGASGGIWSCREGLGQLIERISAQLGPSLRTGSAATAVMRAEQGVEIHTEHDRLRYDAVILALPAPALGQLHSDLDPLGALPSIAAIPQGSMAVVSLGYRREAVAHPLDGFGVLAATVERRRILGVLFASSLFADRAPAGHVLLTAFVGGGRQPDALRHDDTVLIGMVADELRDILQITGAHVFQNIARWHDVMPQTVAGHADRVAAADALEARVPQIAFAGAWHDGLAVGETMSSGVRAADRIGRRLSAVV